VQIEVRTVPSLSSATSSFQQQNATTPAARPDAFLSNVDAVVRLAGPDDKIEAEVVRAAPDDQSAVAAQRDARIIMACDGDVAAVARRAGYAS